MYLLAFVGPLPLLVQLYAREDLLQVLLDAVLGRCAPSQLLVLIFFEVLTVPADLVLVQLVRLFPHQNSGWGGLGERWAGFDRGDLTPWEIEEVRWLRRHPFLEAQLVMSHPYVLIVQTRIALPLLWLRRLEEHEVLGALLLSLLLLQALELRWWSPFLLGQYLRRLRLLLLFCRSPRFVPENPLSDALGL